MIRLCVPAAICMFSTVAQAQTLSLPGMSPEQPAPAPTCENVPYSQDNCVRALACLGNDGLYFDGLVRGWNAGGITGALSDGTACVGRWTSEGLGGTGLAWLECGGGLTAEVIYYTQDNDTGTAIGYGKDNLGRGVTAWSGINVLAFLTKDGVASLPCGTDPVPIS